MTSRRFYTILFILIGLLLVGLVVGTYGLNKLLVSEADKLSKARAKNQALAQEQLGLNKAKKDLQKYSDLIKISKAVVPQDKNQAEATREIIKIAADNSVQLASITFPASTLGGTSVAQSSSLATPPPAATGQTSLSQLTPVKNIPGVYSLPVTITGDPNQPVAYDRFINFLSGLEHNRRTAQVSSINIQPDTKDRNTLTFSLILNEYIKP